MQQDFSTSPNRKTMHSNFMRRVDENPLNFSNFLKPKKPKVPSYLKEVRFGKYKRYLIGLP